MATPVVGGATSCRWRGRRKGASERARLTWRDEEGLGEFAVGDTEDVLGHVDEPAGRRRHSVQAEDPGDDGTTQMSGSDWVNHLAKTLF